MATEDPDDQSSAPGLSPMRRTQETTVSSSRKKGEAEHLQAAAVSPALDLSLDCEVRGIGGEKMQCESLGVEGAQRTAALCCLFLGSVRPRQAWMMDQRHCSAQVQLGEPVSESAVVT